MKCEKDLYDIIFPILTIIVALISIISPFALFLRDDTMDLNITALSNSSCGHVYQVTVFKMCVYSLALILLIVSFLPIKRLPQGLGNFVAYITVLVNFAPTIWCDFVILPGVCEQYYESIYKIIVTAESTIYGVVFMGFLALMIQEACAKCNRYQSKVSSSSSQTTLPYYTPQVRIGYNVNSTNESYGSFNSDAAYNTKFSMENETSFISKSLVDEA